MFFTVAMSKYQMVYKWGVSISNTKRTPETPVERMGLFVLGSIWEGTFTENPRTQSYNLQQKWDDRSEDESNLRPVGKTKRIQHTTTITYNYRISCDPTRYI